MNAQHRKFASEYIRNGFNGVQAVFSAGYAQGYNSACVQASRLLRNDKVKKFVDNHLLKSKMDAEETVERITDFARADIAEVLEPDGSFDISSAKQRNKSKLIKSLKFDKDTGKVVGLETYSAHEAARDIGKIHKLFVERVESTDTSERDGIASGLLQSIQTAAKRDNISAENAAIQLFPALRDLPGLSDIEAWPAEYRDAIRASLNPLKPEQIDEIGGEQ